MKLTSLIACVLLCAAVQATADSVVIVHSGHPAAGGNGRYGTFSNPVLNYQGQLAFRSDLYATSGGADDNQGIFVVGNGFEEVMCRTDWLTPDGNGRFDELNEPAMISAGQVVFRGDARDTAGGSGHDSIGIYRSTGPGTVSRIARANTPAPDGNGWFDGVSDTPVLDVGGGVSFTASFRDTIKGQFDEWGVVTHNQGTLELVARGGQTVPGGDGQYFFFSKLGRNQSNLAFTATLRNTSEGDVNDRGVYKVQLSNPASYYELVREGDPVPDGNGEFRSIQTSPILNSLSRVAFETSLTDTSGGGDDDAGVYLVGTEGIIRIARSGQAPPDGNGVYSGFSNVTQGDLRASFIAYMRDTVGGSGDNRGVYWGNGINTYKIARASEPAVDGDGVFSNFNHAVSNISGHTAFQATLTGTAGGSVDNEALYIGDGFDLLEIARKDDTVLSRAVVELYMANTGARCRNGINSLGQVAYRVVLSNGDQALMLYTPPIQWKNGSGSWEVLANWTLGIKPIGVHDVTIAPLGGADVTGPRDNATVKNLTIGSTDNAGMLNVGGGGNVTVAEMCTIMPNGTVEVGPGHSLTADDVTNQGSIDIARGGSVYLGGLTGNGCSGGGTAWLGGDVRPAFGVGLMSFDGDATFDSQCTTYIQLDPYIAAPSFDRIAIEGNLMLDGLLVLEWEAAPPWLTAGQTLKIIDVTGISEGRFDGLAEGALVDVLEGVRLHITYLGGDGNDVELYAVPEPGALAMLVLSALALSGRRRNTPHIG